LQPGHPELSLDQQYENGKLTVRVFQNQDTLHSPLYKLPVKIGVWTNGKKNEYPVIVSKFRNVFEFPSATKPELILFDTEAQLLATVRHEKTDDELIYQYTHTDRFLPKFEALNKLIDRAHEPKIAAVFQDALKDKFWRLRSTAVFAYNTTRFMMAEKEANQSVPLKGEEAQTAKIIETIRQMALTDPKTSVRSDAIATLASYRSGKYNDIFVKAIQDSSYVVAAAGVDALVGMENVSEYLPKIQALKSTENDNVISALGTFYARHGNGSEYAWFEKQIDNLSDASLNSFLQTFAGYLYKAQPSDRAKGIQLLNKIARTHKTYYVRMGAMQGLAILGDEPGVKDYIREIKAQEKDERLLEIYRSIP